MRQAVMVEPGKIAFHEVPDPEPGPGQVRVRVCRIGVCGSDVHVNHGKHPYTGYPVVQGHEYSAVVDRLGPGVSGLEPGAKVTSTPQQVCGTCAPCLRGDYHICDQLRVEGFQAPGCAQDYFVTRAENIVPLPSDFTFEQGALVEPTAVAVHAVARAGCLEGRNVVVIGAGPIGNLVAQVARASGANVLISDPIAFRLEVAKQCGIPHTAVAGKEPLKEAVCRAFGSDGFQVAFECAGVEAAIQELVPAIAKGGTIVIVGVYPEQARVDLGLVQDRELTLTGSLMYRKPDYERAVELIAGGHVQCAPLETAHFDFAEYAQAYAYIDANRDRTMKVFIDLV
jgi:L-iditol 2-dehydrogenase